MSEYTAEMATEAARLGALWMDEHCEGWELLIDLKRLDLSQGDRCILGQTAHCVTKGEAESNYRDSYDRAIQYVMDATAYEIEATDFADEHGFLTPSTSWDDAPQDVNVYEWVENENMARWEMLGIAWKEEIRKRMEAPV